MGLLCLRCFCSCCSFPLHALAWFWLQQQQLFTLFVCHVWRRRQEELGEGKPCLSVQVCMRGGEGVLVCVWVCEHISDAWAEAGWFLLGCLSSERGGESAKFHLSKGAASQGAGNLPSLQSSEESRALFKFFTAPLHLQRTEVISPRKRDVY